MKAATALMNRIMLALSGAGFTAFRNNSGLGWSGRVVNKDPARNTVTLADARPVKFGLTNGAADLIGLKSITITPDMVGKKVAVFCAWEVKSGSGRATAEQKHFIEFVRDAGGIAEVVRTEQDAISARLFES
ncbi:VRR-NUC domain-containing protein [Sinorhizobium meliloti]|uniref:VRR-NUC domain-containing protein n=1 Tax=Rhizobium meliloti TaxID=382 RepID=UPI000FD768AE|nr:VRR-NUC domain-containing protein [Sinorhizobium meliloti]RVH56247.1 VRR-NUC domain-containing protein [Sinorhizobium meliloti]